MAKSLWDMNTEMSEFGMDKGMNGQLPGKDIQSPAQDGYSQWYQKKP